jgi:hypothetical protein
MTRKEIISEFDKAKINFDYANNKDNGYSADWISEDFSSVLDLVEILVNKNSVLANVSESLICGSVLGVENCGFETKDAFTCKHIRKCDMCGNE